MMRGANVILIRPTCLNCNKVMSIEGPLYYNPKRNCSIPSAIGFDPIVFIADHPAKLVDRDTGLYFVPWIKFVGNFIKKEPNTRYRGVCFHELVCLDRAFPSIYRWNVLFKVLEYHLNCMWFHKREVIFYYSFFFKIYNAVMMNVMYSW